MGDLTGKQRAFIDAWFACNFNGVEAARQAGYQGKDNTLRSIASENLTKPNILAEIERRWKVHGVTAAEVVSQWAKISRANVADLYTDAGVLDWSKVKEHGELIESIEWFPGSKLKVKFYSKQDALDSLARVIGLYAPTKVDATLSKKRPEDFTDDELARIAGLALDAGTGGSGAIAPAAEQGEPV